MIPEEILLLLQRQHGLVADRQIAAAAPSKAARRRVYEHPEIERIGPRVRRHLATTATVDQGLMHAALDAGDGALLWGKTAAALWGFGPFRVTPAHAAVARSVNCRGPRVARVHAIRDLDPAAGTTVSDLPVCRPEETVLWLCGMWTHRVGHELALARMEATIDQAWRDDLIDGHAIHALAERSGGRGRSGIVVLRALLDRRPPDYQPSGSGLEDRFEEIVSWEVRSALERQVRVDDERTIRIVDYRLRTWPLIVEVNGFGHTSLTERENDAERYRRLLDQGYSVVVWWAHDIFHDRDTVRTVMSHLQKHPDDKPTLHRPTRAPWQP